MPVVGAVVLVAAGLWACAGAVSVALRGWELPNFDVSDGRPRLHPIAIPETSCPFVEAIHSEADRFQQTYTNARFGGYSETQVPWSVQKRQIDDAARSLDFAIAIGEPTFPPRITRHLTRVREALEQGRALLAPATGADELNLVEGPFRDGQEHFGYASDLVGRQCAVPLRANSNTLFPSFATTTTTLAIGPVPR